MSHQRDTNPRDRSQCIPKVIGADAELGNLVLGVDQSESTGHIASRAVLREVDGVPSSRHTATVYDYRDTAWGGIDASYTPYAADAAIDAPSQPATATDNPQDIGRKYLAENGGCIYIDLDHVEVCTPELRSAHDFVAAWHAQLRIVRNALVAANAKRAADERIMVLVNSSDGLGNAYGSHLNFLVTRRLFDDLFVRKLHPELFLLAAYQVSSIVFTGQGKVGAENDRPAVKFQLTQRGDFFDRIVALPTTFDRPIVNSRDEPLTGPRWGRDAAAGASLARLHCIFYDSSLCHVANLLKVGVMQIVLSMLEAQCLSSDLILADPLSALIDYGHDPDLNARARLTDGRQLSAVELQMLFCERARSHVDAGRCDGLVPNADAIVTLWEETLSLLAQRDLDRLAPRIDWVLKRTQIERALTARGLEWTAPAAKHLDHLYASLDPNEGLYWALEAAGCTQTVIPESRIAHFMHAPPDDTRAYTRAMLLKHLPRNRIRSVDWDAIDIDSTEHTGARLRVSLPDPLGSTREHWEAEYTGRHSDDEAMPASNSPHETPIH